MNTNSIEFTNYVMNYEFFSQFNQYILKSINLEKPSLNSNFIIENIKNLKLKSFQSHSFAYKK